MSLDGQHIELGAQWIHGQKENVLYELAAERNLLMEADLECGFEGVGQFVAEDGTLVDQDLVQELINYLDAEKEAMCEAVEVEDQNVFGYFRNKFDQFVSNKKKCLADKDYNLLRWTFRWFILFEMIDNSCDKLSDLSVLSYTEWKDYDGLDLVNLRQGYQSIIDELVAEFNFRQHLRLSTAVTRLEIVPGGGESLGKVFKVKLYTESVADVYNVSKETEEDGGEFEVFDTVLLTSSIGFLKHALSTKFFNFVLPRRKRTVIESLGFGNINKMFFYFDKPFWSVDTFKGLQLLWQNANDQEDRVDAKECRRGFAAWAYDIQGFDPVLHQPNMLIAWIGGTGAKLIDSMDELHIRQQCQLILQTFVPAQRSEIERPKHVYFERWSSHAYIRGAYSHRPMSYQQLGQLSPEVECNVDILAQPIRAVDVAAAITTTAATASDVVAGVDQYDQYNLTTPLVLFAGEATDREHFSTTDGAFRSGVREANRLVDYYRNSL